MKTSPQSHLVAIWKCERSVGRSGQRSHTAITQTAQLRARWRRAANHPPAQSARRSDQDCRPAEHHSLGGSREGDMAVLCRQWSEWMLAQTLAAQKAAAQNAQVFKRLPTGRGLKPIHSHAREQRIEVADG